MAFADGVFPLYMLQKPPFTVEAPGSTPVEGETIPRIHPKAKNGLLSRPAPGINTAFDILKQTVEKHGNEPAVGTRKLIKVHKEKKKAPKNVDGQIVEVEREWTFFELSDFSFLTYSEYETLVLQLGAGLTKLGLSPRDKLHIFAGTSAQWLGMAHACASQALSIVTSYDTLGESGVEHSLVQTQANAIFTDPHLLKTIVNPLKKASSVKFVILNNLSHQPIPDAELESFKSSHPNLSVLTFDELRALGEENPVPPTLPEPEDTYCIMYTSGSTGMPKGVEITHGSFVAGVAGLYGVIEGVVSHRDSVLAYLPLAHILEMVLENVVLLLGATMGYGSPRTLSDVNMRNSPGDMRALKPTVLVGVPQVWETVKKGVVGRVESASSFAKSLFWGAYRLKSFLVDNGLPGQTLLDGAVFGRVRAVTGGRLRFIVNGGSGIAEETARFMSLVVAPMINGYGLTETTACGALGSPNQFTIQAIGAIPPSIEAKLVSIPDLGYSTSTTPPQGEILIRGKPVLKSYYNNPEETAKAITPDGWFRTGDIGEFDTNGHLRVIDRLKNLVKLQGGEYIALEKLEAVYRSAHIVQNIMIYGDSAYPRPIAIIVPNEKFLADLAAQLRVEEHSAHTSEKVREAVLKDLLAAAKKAGFSSIELVAGVVLVDEEWTPANGLVTATQKLNRRQIKERYQKQINSCFAGK